MTIKIVTDSTCDLPQSIIERYDIRVAPMYINIGQKGYLDGIDITREEFYKGLPNFPFHPTTAAPSPKSFQDMYVTLAESGASEVLSIHISSALSAVANVATIAARETKRIMVTVMDSGQLSLGTGFLVETAAKLADKGHSIAEILSFLNDQKLRSHVFAVLDTLEFLKRSGRMNKYVAGLGSLLQLKPILTMHNGKPGNERVRGRDHATRRLLEMIKQLGPIERLAIVHTHAEERVAELKASVAHLVPLEDILVEDITPVIGAHIGPGAYGFAAIKAG